MNKRLSVDELNEWHRLRPKAFEALEDSRLRSAHALFEEVVALQFAIFRKLEELWTPNRDLRIHFIGFLGYSQIEIAESTVILVRKGHLLSSLRLLRSLYLASSKLAYCYHFPEKSLRLINGKKVPDSHILSELRKINDDGLEISYDLMSKIIHLNAESQTAFKELSFLKNPDERLLLHSRMIVHQCSKFIIDTQAYVFYLLRKGNIAGIKALIDERNSHCRRWTPIFLETESTYAKVFPEPNTI